MAADKWNRLETSTMGGHRTGAAPPAGAARVTEVQKLLAAHGHDPGVRHGQLDHATRASVKSFQIAKGLTPTGMVDPATDAKLRQPASRQGGRRTQRLEAGTPIGGATHHRASSQGHAPKPSNAPAGAGSTNMRAKDWKSAGKRVPLVLSASVAAGASATIKENPQMDFRGENVVVDTDTAKVFSMTMPQVGNIPQVAGGTSSQAFPCTLFSPAQAGALDFAMDIANQGNAITTTVTSSATVTATFVATIFGHEVFEE